MVGGIFFGFREIVEGGVRRCRRQSVVAGAIVSGFGGDCSWCMAVLILEFREKLEKCLVERENKNEKSKLNPKMGVLY